MLIFAGITPHSPLLIPAVGKENTKKLGATINSLNELEDDFYASQIDTLLIITPDDTINKKSFVINFSPAYGGNFSEFGDFSLKPAYRGDNALAFIIKDAFKKQELIKLTTVEKLSHHSLVPLHFLGAHKKDFKILPFHTAEFDFAAHFNFGADLIEVILDSPKRIAVISSLETSSQLSKNSPGGYSPKAKKFDQKIIDLLKNKRYSELAEISPEQADKAGFNEIKALLILAGMMSKINHQTDVLSYEAPFGVGNLTAEFRM
ncbi:MAG: class III extradiol dioxygenase subunit B-like domain-containing protein [Patescibacteria group bacterium]